MDAGFYRRLARRCRELASRAAREEVRYHLDLIAADLEAQAEAAERELRDAADRTPAYDPKTDLAPEGVSQDTPSPGPMLPL
jgi:hypothetical protein